MKPIRFNRVAAAFDEVSRTARLYQSSGSEHSVGVVEEEEDGESPIDLSDLVASFMEREGAEVAYVEDDDGAELEVGEVTRGGEELGDETRDQLRGLLDQPKSYEGERIRSEVEAAMGRLKDKSPVRDLKRWVVVALREKGFDAGLCKSKWEKTPRFPAGDYQYIDVKLPDGTRFIVEPLIRVCFEIARPTGGYSSLLGLLPRVFVGRPEELKQVARVMCTAVRRSMKGNGLSVPPWRKSSYMQAMWFGPYKRTTNRVSSLEGSGVAGSEMRRTVGFVATPPPEKISYKCREDFGCKNLLRVGHLAAVFGQD
ncbi:hypothetical protein SAY86_000588 [Trapa natans]|uniref:DUF506 family protein n=1 Tax=Trapa natans TaxID=22666 RepID=A0AAN7RGS5_TRANT|nr:hypothetical protein SAY86_000588 [Trapa natans]